MISRQKIKIIGLIFIGFIIRNSPIYAQGNLFKYKADVQKIDTSGIYKIELSSDLCAKSVASLHDLRLFDSHEKEIAYALSSDLSIDVPSGFIAFPEIKSSANTDTVTVYISENKDKLSINRLWVKLRNTDANRTIDISGSDNLQTWFAIKENIPLAIADDSNAPDYEQALTFPTSSYHYFKIKVNGKNKNPIDILQSGIYVVNSYKPEFSALSAIQFSARDSDKKTGILIHLNQPYQINKLHLDISAPKFYNRRVVVYDVGNKQGSEICDTVLSSSGSQDILLSAKTTDIKLNIFNGDDNSLIISHIQAFQKKQYIITYLQGSYSYYILTGDSSAKPANYDLSFLKGLKYSLLPVINHSAVYKNAAYKVHRSLTAHNYTFWLWLSIVLVLLALIFFTWKMMREVNTQSP